MELQFAFNPRKAKKASKKRHKKAKIKKSNKKKGGSMAKKRRKRKASKKHTKKLHRKTKRTKRKGLKHKAKSKHKKVRRKKARRAHRHSLKTRHVKKGAKFSGTLKRRGKKKKGDLASLKMTVVKNPRRKKRRNPQSFVVAKKFKGKRKASVRRLGKHAEVRENLFLSARLDSAKNLSQAAKAMGMPKSVKGNVKGQIKRVQKLLKAAEQGSKHAAKELKKYERKGWKLKGVMTFKSKRSKKGKMHRKLDSFYSKQVKSASNPRRKRAKTYKHKHKGKTSHIKKGKSFKFKSKGWKGKFMANPMAAFNGVLGGLKEDTIETVKDIGYYAAGAGVETMLAAYVLPKIPGVAQLVTAVEGVAPGAGAHVASMLLSIAAKYGLKQVAPSSVTKISDKVLNGATTVGAVMIGYALFNKFAKPMLGLSGVTYYPYSGMGIVPQGLGNVKYFPMSGRGGEGRPQMGNVQFFPGTGMSGYPQMGEMPQLAGADFGAQADFGAGYTEDQKYSRADFGDDGSDDADFGDEIPDGDMGSVMG